MIDVAAVKAIDVHVHTERSRDGHDPLPPELRAAAAHYFKSDEPLPTFSATPSASRFSMASTQARATS